MVCKICEIIKDGKKIYQDKSVVAFLADDSAVAGLIQVTTTKHHTIFEHLTDDETAHVFKVVNKVSSILVNYLKIQGVNIVVNNGVDAGQLYPHFVVNVVPRYENDNIDFNWQTKQVSNEDLDAVYNKLLLAIKDDSKPEGKDEVKQSSSEEIRQEGDENENDEIIEEEKDYLIGSLDRIP